MAEVAPKEGFRNGFIERFERDRIHEGCVFAVVDLILEEEGYNYDRVRIPMRQPLPPNHVLPGDAVHVNFYLSPDGTKQYMFSAVGAIHHCQMANEAQLELIAS